MYFTMSNAMSDTMSDELIHTMDDYVKIDLAIPINCDINIVPNGTDIVYDASEIITCIYMKKRVFKWFMKKYIISSRRYRNHGFYIDDNVDFFDIPILVLSDKDILHKANIGSDGFKIFDEEIYPTVIMQCKIEVHIQNYIVYKHINPGLFRYLMLKANYNRAIGILQNKWRSVMVVRAQQKRNAKKENIVMQEYILRPNGEEFLRLSKNFESSKDPKFHIDLF